MAKKAVKSSQERVRVKQKTLGSVNNNSASKFAQ